MSQQHPLNNGSGPLRAWKALLCSIDGISAALRHESAFRQELALLLIFAPLAFWLGESTAHTILLISLMVIVLIVELLNSAIETTIDRFSLEQHELAGRAKDLASAAVFLSLTLNVFALSLSAYQKFA